LDHIDNSKDLQLMLYDVSGKEVMRNIFKSQQGKQHIFNLNPDLPNGLYLLQIISHDGLVLFTKKLQIVR